MNPGAIRSRVARSSVRALVVGLWLFSIAPQGGAQAQDIAARKARASEHFRQGIALFREGAFQTALIEFERAYTALPDYRVLYNIGQTALAAGKYVRATQAFEGYLQKGGPYVDDARRADVERRIALMAERIGHVSIHVSEPDVPVYLDGVEVGRSPLPPVLPVDAGRHQAFVLGEDGKKTMVAFDVAGGEYHDVVLHLERPKYKDAVPPLLVSDVGEPRARTPRVPLATEVDEPLSARDRRGLGMLTAAGAVAIGAAVAGLGFALKAHDDYEATLRDAPSESDRIARLREELDRATWATSGLAAGAVALGITGALLLVTGEPSETGERLPVRVGVSAQGVSASGRF